MARLVGVDLPREKRLQRQRECRERFEIAFGLGLKEKQVNKCVNFLRAMYNAFTDLD